MLIVQQVFVSHNFVKLRTIFRFRDVNRMFLDLVIKSYFSSLFILWAHTFLLFVLKSKYLITKKKPFLMLRKIQRNKIKILYRSIHVPGLFNAASSRCYARESILESKVWVIKNSNKLVKSFVQTGRLFHKKKIQEKINEVTENIFIIYSIIIISLYVHP